MIRGEPSGTCINIRLTRMSATAGLCSGPPLLGTAPLPPPPSQMTVNSADLLLHGVPMDRPEIGKGMIQVAWTADM